MPGLKRASQAGPGSAKNLSGCPRRIASSPPGSAALSGSAGMALALFVSFGDLQRCRWQCVNAMLLLALQSAALLQASEHAHPRGPRCIRERMQRTHAGCLRCRAPRISVHVCDGALSARLEPAAPSRCRVVFLASRPPWPLLHLRVTCLYCACLQPEAALRSLPPSAIAAVAWIRTRFSAGPWASEWASEVGAGR